VLVADFVRQGKIVNVSSYSVTLVLLRAAIKRKRPKVLPEGVQQCHTVPMRLDNCCSPSDGKCLEHPAKSAVLATSDYHLFSTKRSFWSPQTSKRCRSEESYDVSVAIEKHGLLWKGNLDAASVI
jgi:hypothetical protein